MSDFEKLIEEYREYSKTRDEAIEMIEILKFQIKQRRTEIASQVLSAIDEKGRKIYSNDMQRSTEIDKRAFEDKDIAKWQNRIFQLEREKREAEREMQILWWIIEAKIRSPQVV